MISLHEPLPASRGAHQQCGHVSMLLACHCNHVPLLGMRPYGASQRVASQSDPAQLAHLPAGSRAGRSRQTAPVTRGASAAGGAAAATLPSGSGKRPAVAPASKRPRSDTESGQASGAAAATQRRRQR